MPTRGTRTLAEIYGSCSLAIKEPVGFNEAAGFPEWMEAMKEEMQSINKNQTWKLVPRPENRKVIGVKWIFRTKVNPDGTINKLKARLVVKGYAQRKGIDFNETFAPVTRFDTVRLLLALAAQKSWYVHHLDIKSAFLNGYLEEEIYVEQPDGFKEVGQQDQVYLLKKALYGLKQAPRAWNTRVDQYLVGLGFNRSASEPALYIKLSNQVITVISLYVDDFLITGNCEENIKDFKRRMKLEFEMTDLGKMTYFLGMEIVQSDNVILLHQQKYTTEILKKFKMNNSKPVSTPAAVKLSLRKQDNSTTKLKEDYRSMVGKLMYLTNTRPDISQAVGVLSRYLHCAGPEHMQAAKRVLRYLKGSSSYGLKFTKEHKSELICYSDSDWAGSWDMKSTSGSCYSLGSGIFSWSSKKQSIVAQSTAEAEFIAATTAANQVIWLKKILCDLGEEQQGATSIYVDNKSSIAIANNPTFHGKTKHFNIKLYFLRDAQKEGGIKLKYCKSDEQLADIFTKPLQTTRFEVLRSKLGMMDLDSRRSVVTI